MSELNKLDRMIDLTKDNINQLLWIGIHNNDENIKEVYGGERCLLELIKGYFTLLEDMQGFKFRIEKYENKECANND
jgi:hypothetical protein